MVFAGKGEVFAMLLVHNRCIGYNFIIHMGNTPCGQITTTYKVPLNAVNKDYNNFPMIEYRELFHYPARYPYILSYLRKNNMLFEDMYFPINETKQIMGTGLLKEIGFPILWKRINHLVYKRNVRFNQTLFHQQPQRYKEPHSMYRLLLWITSMPQLMKKMFTFQTLNQEGLVLVYLPINGSHDQPVQIVIDDDIPMREDNQYYCALPQTNNVAMVLLEKALAKVLGSYEKARSLPMKEIFEILIGLPVVMQSIGNRDPLSFLERYYKPHYHIVSHNKKLQNHQPQYFKFTVGIDSEVSISIWQLLENPHSFEMSTPGNIVMELMRILSEQKVERVAYSSKLHKDKTFLRTLTPEQEKGMSAGRDFLNLPRGNYLLHIYTKTQNVSVNSNLIINSSSPISLTYRKQNYELNSYKKKMVEDIFLRHNRELQKCMFTERVYSKFIWDGFRGILAFKSEEPVRIKITLLIKTEYRRKIKFQHSEQYEETVFLKPQTKKIISFVKFVETDVGNFYEQHISYMKKDMEIQQFTPNVIQNNPYLPPGTPSYPTKIDISSSPFREVHEFDTYKEEDSMMSESKQFVNMNPNKNYGSYH